MIKDSKICGFTLKQTRVIEEMKGKLWEMEHEKSGAKLVWLERDDDNMTFSIGFRTIPEDSTGVFHILEHSVLCGSDKYPVKEPFVELLKSSLQTFLNAMTFPDKTIYPVSSRNKQDFLNLVSVYMDAVLNPTAAHNPNIFRQEGWRFEMQEGEAPIYQGVVYNEMKGAYSNVRSALEHEMDSRLFPDTCYRHSSGGDPAHIPELTYEQFVNSHKKYYHPSNALIVLDGKVELEAVLTLIGEFLNGYDRIDVDFPIDIQKPVEYSEVTVPYEIGAGEEIKGKTIVSYGRLFGTYADLEELYAANILADYLAGGSEAPLKRAILSAGLGADLSVSLHDGTLQSWFGWSVWNTDEEKIPQIKELIRNTLADIAEKGLDKERLEGCYSSLAFNLLNRDAGGPRGVIETITILESWLYGGDPAQNLSFQKPLDELRKKLDTGYFEELIRKTLLDCSTGVLVTLVPSQTLGAERLEEEKARVAAAWNALSEAGKEKTKESSDAIRLWQQTPDSAEALATIPILKLSDVDEKPAPLPMTMTKNGNTDILRHKIDNNLIYADLFFNASDVSEEELPLISLMCSLMTKMPTKKHTGAQLQTLIKQKAGELGFGPDVYSKDTDEYLLNLSAHLVCLPELKEEASALLLEILTDTVFEDTSILRDTLLQTKNGNQMSLISRGNMYAIYRVAARQTAAGAAREKYSGCEYISFINELCKADDEKLKEVLASISALYARVFTRSRLTLSVSESVGEFTEKTLTEAFAEGNAPASNGKCALLPPCREGILIPAGVGYAAKGANIKRFGYQFNGSVLALSKLISLEHLWNEVRVQGGAYGCGFSGGDSGDFMYYSYRDPSPARTFGCFDGSADFMKKYCAENASLDKFILGAVSDVEPRLGASGKKTSAETRYFKGVTYEDICRTRKELLSTTPEKLIALEDALKAVADANNVCVVGGKAQLDACGEKLEAIKEILI